MSEEITQSSQESVPAGEQIGESIVSNTTEPVNQTFSIPHSVSQETPATETEQDVKPEIKLEDYVPDEYKQKPYMGKVKSFDDLFKAFDNAQSLLGKRGAHVPQEGASDDEWNAFYDTLGRPEKPEGYKVEIPDELPKGFEIKDEDLGAFKQTAHEVGLTPKQVQALFDFDLKRQQSVIESVDNLNKQKDTEFDNLVAQTFGDRVDGALNNSKELLTKYAPPEFANEINSLDNKTLVALASVLDSITRDYIKEDSPARIQAAPRETQEEMHQRALKLKQSEAYRNPWHVEHDKTVKEVKDLYQRAFGGGNRR